MSVLSEDFILYKLFNIFVAQLLGINCLQLKSLLKFARNSGISFNLVWSLIYGR